MANPTAAGVDAAASGMRITAAGLPNADAGVSAAGVDATRIAAAAAGVMAFGGAAAGVDAACVDAAGLAAACDVAAGMAGVAGASVAGAGIGVSDIDTAGFAAAAAAAAFCLAGASGGAVFLAAGVAPERVVAPVSCPSAMSIGGSSLSSHSSHCLRLLSATTQHWWQYGWVAGGKPASFTQARKHAMCMCPMQPSSSPSAAALAHVRVATFAQTQPGNSQRAAMPT